MARTTAPAAGEIVGKTLVMARRESLRGQLYRSARLLGNVEAAEKGPGAYARRTVRRKVYRKINGLLAKFLRGLGS